MKKREVAGLIILSSDNRVLLQHRDDNPLIGDPNRWCLWGGGFKEGETPLQALQRELLEELQIGLHNPKLIIHKTIVDKYAENDFYVFLHPQEWDLEYLRQHQQEGQGLGLFGREELDNLDIVKPAMEVLLDFFDKNY